MSSPSTNAEVTAADTAGRWPLLLLFVSGLKWLVVSGILGLISSIQLHSPTFLANCSWFTHGRVAAMAETAFIYGWAGNAGLGVALWVLGRLGGSPLRASNWTVVGTIFWNFALALGLVFIAVGEATSFSLLEMPKYIQPLMVVAYVGFVGGYLKALFGPGALLLAGTVAASLVTWFTFLPSFLFILGGGPLVESTHNDLKFSAPLSAITAAVVGVIVNLALFFGYHVLWPQGFNGHFDVLSAVLTVAASAALFVYKRNVIHVILACALVGLVAHLAQNAG